MMLQSPLARMLRSYLHQDFDLRYPDVTAALRAYARETAPEERSRALSEIDSLLCAHADDADLLAALRRRGFIFYPPRDGETTRSWLRRARSVIAG